MAHDSQSSPDDTSDMPKRDWRFWLVFASMCLISLSTSLDSTIITTSLPTIVKQLNAQDEYVWIGNSFLLASTVVQPLTGQLADIFGRRWPMIVSVLLFILGSGIAGGASSAQMLIGGRTVQGIGSGGIFVLLDIITCDLVPVRERGKFLGLVLSTGAVGSTLGPIVGGALADTNWRWCFYITLITAGIGLFAILFFLNVKAGKSSTPALRRIDWLGNAIFIPSITSLLLGLVMGGNNYPWGTYHVIVPIVLGFVGWVAFHLYEMSPLCKSPSVPPRLFSNRTSFIGFILAFDSYILLMWFVIFLPVYFQGVLGTNALVSGVNMLPLSIFLVPSGIVAGGVLSKTGKFKPMHWAGFAITAVASGLLSILDQNSPKIEWAWFEIISACGIGIAFTTILPAIQAALSETDQAAATATYSFIRSFGFIWGLVIPAIIFNNQFDSHNYLISDPVVRQALANGQAYALVSGGYVQSLAPNIQAEVITTYVAALKPVWEAAIGFSLLGFFLVFLERHVNLRSELQTEYGLKDAPDKPLDDLGVAHEKGEPIGTSDIQQEARGVE